ncbi:MAG: hypothetical protein Q7S40_28930 [Opitutaceae bacterium]|nr:hypothetical protein [Opitutaceae bacterium]
MTSGGPSDLWDLYLDAFRLHSHQLLAWAHADVRSRLHADLDEPSITGLVAEAMKARLNSHPDTPDEYDHYWIGDQEPISPAGQLGNDRLRLDVSVIRTGIRPRLSYIFEGKRLRTGSFTIGKYVGAGGIGDFIEGRYGVDCPEAAMVGFMQDRDAAYWHKELRRAYEEDIASGAPRLGIVQPLRTVEILNELTDELQSNHSRSNGTALQLLHIFLPATN